MNEYTDLEDDEDVKERESFALAERERLKKEDMEKQRQELQLTEEQNKQVIEACKASPNVDSTPELNGLMAFDEYMKVFSIIVALQIRFTIEINEDNRDERQDALENDDKATFASITSKQLELVNKTKGGVTMTVLDYFKIDPQLYNRSGRHSHDTEESARRVGETAGKIEITEFRKAAEEYEDYEELDKATTLKHIGVLEEKKSQFLTGIYIQLELGQFPEAQIPLAVEMARIQALDQLEIDKGITDIQISIGFRLHNLQFDEAFGRIIQKNERAIGEAVDKALREAGRGSHMAQEPDEDFGVYEEEQPDFGWAMD